MLENIAVCMAKKLCDTGDIPENEINIYKYGIEIILTSLVGIVSIFLYQPKLPNELK